MCSRASWQEARHLDESHDRQGSSGITPPFEGTAKRNLSQHAARPWDRVKAKDFASVKLSRPFASWLKREAAKRGVPMYELVEQLAEIGLRQRPWRIDQGPR